MANSLVKAKTAKVKPGGEGMKTRPSRFGTTKPPAIAPGRCGLAAPSSGRLSKHRLLSLHDVDRRQAGDRQIGIRDVLQEGKLLGRKATEVVHFTSLHFIVRRIGHIDHPARRRAFFKTSRYRGAVTRV